MWDKLLMGIRLNLIYFWSFWSDFITKNTLKSTNTAYIFCTLFRIIIFIIRQDILMCEKVFFFYQQLFITSNDVSATTWINDIIKAWHLMTYSSRDLRDNEIYIKNYFMNKKKNYSSLTIWIPLSFIPSNELVAIRKMGGKFDTMKYWITKRHTSHHVCNYLCF